MKLKKIFPCLIIALILTSCEKEAPFTLENPGTADVFASGCTSAKKQMSETISSVRLTALRNDMLKIELNNILLTCGSDSVAIANNSSDNNINITVSDGSPLANCICPNNVSFTYGPLYHQAYNLTLDAPTYIPGDYTFNATFDFSKSLDTTIYIGHSATHLTYDDVLLGGCNGETPVKSLHSAAADETDTIIFHPGTDSLRVFVGLNATCCIEFGPLSEMHGDTLIMKAETLNDDFCDCICYYTFDFFYGNFTGQEIPYRFYLDDSELFEGTFYGE